MKDLKELLKEAATKFGEATDFFGERVKTVRTGRANPQLVENLTISYYGQNLPLKSLAAISVPEPMTIMVAPYDHQSLDDIMLALNNAPDLGLTPNSDGTVVRLNIPALSAERRDQLIRQLHGMAEEARIALRNIREEVWKEIQRQEKEGMLTEDDRETGRRQLDKQIAAANQDIADRLTHKEKEIHE